MRTHYQSDIGKTYFYFPYSAIADTTNSESSHLHNVFDLIPDSISSLILQPVKVECPVTGIKPRYLEIFDMRDNPYKIECPKPWMALTNLFIELESDNRIKGYVAYGEKINYQNLRFL